jgi:modulator of FtsH protease HflK
MSEEPLDPASQSLSEALRASFRVLKVIMLVVVVLFLLSGVFSVGTNERVVVWRLGALTGVAEPGLHFAYPYPIDETFRVNTGLQRMQIDTFWLRINDADKDKALSDLPPRGQRLDPATEGALLTGDRGIVHLQFTAQYQIDRPELFVQNVADGPKLLESVLENAAVVEAGGSKTDELLKGKGEIGARIKARAQGSLDAIASGIKLADVTARLYYPLQAKDAFISVTTAENSKRDAIQEAVSEQTKKLNGMAGPAWTKLYEQIRLLDQVKAGTDRAAVLKEISRLLLEDAQGEAGGKIKLAQSRKQEIVAQAEGEKAGFEAVFNGPEYQKHPEQIKQRLRQKAVTRALGLKGLTKWLLPAGQKQIILWLNKDPVQAKQAEMEAIQQQGGAK